MIQGSPGDNKGSWFKKVFYRVVERWIGGRLYREKYYNLKGEQGVETEAVTPASKKKKRTTNYSRKPSTSIPKAEVPAFVPKATVKPTVMAKPVLTVKDPGAAPVFTFNTAAPTKDEVIVPQPVPDPGPAPVFQYSAGKEVTKYEYVYGIKNMEIKHKQYEPRSIFVSKPIEVEGNVMQVGLHAVEEHPLFDGLDGKASERQTSVEYYITYAENPTQSEWYAILPEDQKTVKCELLMFATSRTAKLRFPAQISGSQRATVYKDQIAMDRSLWTFAEGGTKVQLLVNQDPKAVYTIDYTPNVDAYNPWTIDINQRESRKQKQIDTFVDGTNHNKTVVLSKYPYVDYEKINADVAFDPNLSDYNPVLVRLKNASIQGQNRTTFKEVLPYENTDQLVYTKNVTDYKTGAWKNLKPYSLLSGQEYNGFEYWMENNKLYFSETFNKADIYTNQQTNHGNATIEVEYEYLVSNFRLKIIQRRNTADVNTLTPIVHEYALKFKVMK